MALLFFPFLAQAVQYDFAYYQEQVLRLFPLFNLDSAAVSFVEVTETPSVDQRQQQQNTIFLNPTILNTKPLSIALFACAVEAKLGTLSPDQWKQITEYEKTPPIMPLFLALLPTLFLGTPLFIAHVLDKKSVNFVSTLLISLIGAGWIGSYALDTYNRAKDEEAHSKSVAYEFEYRKCCVQMDLLVELLKSDDTAGLAIAGLIPTKIQHKKTIDRIKEQPALYAGLIGMSLINRMNQIELIMELWMSKHPEHMQKFEEQFKDECKPFEHNQDLSILEV